MICDSGSIVAGRRWIKISDCHDPNAHINSVGLTFDLDWACDAVLKDSIDIVYKFDVPATWFVTHATPLLDRLRENPNYELGIHPNFNPLLDGRDSRSMDSLIDDLSHSMVQSSRLMELFKRKGLLFDCNHFIPEQSRIELRPWKLWNGITKVPHFWEDDATCIYEENATIASLIARKGLKIFDFHPIHVFLNTEDLTRYEQSRASHSDADSLLCHRYDGVGTRTYLIQLLEQTND